MFHKQHPALTDLCSQIYLYCEKSLKSNLEIRIKIVSKRGSVRRTACLINQFTCHTHILICRYLISYNYLQLWFFFPIYTVYSTCAIFIWPTECCPLSAHGVFTFHWLQGSIIFICYIYGIGVNSFLHFLYRLRHIYCCFFAVVQYIRFLFGILIGNFWGWIDFLGIISDSHFGNNCTCENFIFIFHISQASLTFLAELSSKYI